MKKLFIWFMVAALAFPLCACSSGETEETDPGGMPQNTAGDSDHKEGGLRLLNSSLDQNGCACGTEDGYYYLSGDTVELRDGNYGSHLMYMDYASCREIYLCSTAGCEHDSPDCPAVFLYDDFPVFTTMLFMYNHYLYILSREYDNDGAVEQNMVTGDYEEEPESSPAVLYRANPDGTERKKVYTFDSELTLEDLVMADENGIYVITKKLSVEKTDTESYTTSSERRLMFLDLETCDFTEVCPMTFGDNITWKVMGCYQNSLILNGTDYGHELSREEIWDDDVYKSLYENSSDVYALLDLKTATKTELYRASNKNEHSARVVGDKLYLSGTESQDIERLDLTTGERDTVCTLPQNLIMGVIGDVLCCRDWDLAGDATYYFVDTNTGEISHSSLVNQCNGWSLEFYADTSSDVLVVYDYDADKGSDDSYEIHRYQCALISKEDLFAGNANYRKIDMIGKGY